MSASTHPVAPTSLDALRDALTRAFADAVADLGGTPDVEVLLADDGSGSTRTARGDDGRLVLHETASPRRTTIALTGSSVYGERFWLGASSYDAAPVLAIELDGDLPAFAAPVLGQLLATLRTSQPGQPSHPGHPGHR